MTNWRFEYWTFMSIHTYSMKVDLVVIISLHVHNHSGTHLALDECWASSIIMY
jgi:hypothetical protein